MNNTYINCKSFFALTVRLKPRKIALVHTAVWQAQVPCTHAMHHQQGSISQHDTNCQLVHMHFNMQILKTVHNHLHSLTANSDSNRATLYIPVYPASLYKQLICHLQRVMLSKLLQDACQQAIHDAELPLLTAVQARLLAAQCQRSCRCKTLCPWWCQRSCRCEMLGPCCAFHFVLAASGLPAVGAAAGRVAAGAFVAPLPMPLLPPPPRL